MIDFYRQLAAELAKQPVVLAMVIQTSGSVPGKVGAKLFVCADKTSLGTIGGGIGEEKIYTEALQVLSSGVNSFADVDLSETCGGRMRIWLERWDHKRLPLVQQILIALETENPIAIVTPFDQSPYLLPEWVETPQLTPLGCFIEPLHPNPVLLIIGAGQIAMQLAHLAHLADFRVIVMDARIELTVPARFPDAIGLTTSIDLAVQTLSKARSRYVTLMTRGVEQDIAALRLLLTHPLHYIGMIGSQNRSQQVFQALLNQGFNADQLTAIHTPIGLEIGAETSAEIAMSICAELIKVRRGGKAQTLREAKLMLDD